MADLPPLPRPSRAAAAAVIPLIVAVVVAILVAIGAGACGVAATATRNRRKPPTARAARPAQGKAGAGKGGRFAGGAGGVQPVSAAAATVGDINIVQTALGTATALRSVTVKPRVDGLLTDVNYVEGQVVQAGHRIAQIDPVPLQLAPRSRQGQLARDAAQLNNARLDLDRYTVLLQQDSIATQQVDQQAALVKQLEGTVKIDQSMVDNAKLQLSYTNITAPIGGRLGLKAGRSGQPGAPVRREWRGDHHPDRSDERRLHDSAGRAAEGDRSA